MVTQVTYCKYLVVLVLTWSSLTVALAQDSAASIRISADSPSIYLGDTVVLEVESIGLLEPLNVDSFFTQAEFLRETTGTRIAVFGGRVVEIALRRMEFKPTKAGIVIFGPLAGEAQNGIINSNSVSVSVLPPLDTKWLPAPDDIAIDVQLSNTEAYVGEQVALDIILRHRYPIAAESVDMPSLHAFEVVPIFEERRTQDVDGVRQTHWRYLLHARTAGTINIEAVRWRGTMTRSRTQRSEFSQSSNTLTMNLLPIPAAVLVDWWLPAKTLTLEESWSKDVRSLSAGDEVTRVINLRANYRATAKSRYQ